MTLGSWLAVVGGLLVGVLLLPFALSLLKDLLLAWVHVWREELWR